MRRGRDGRNPRARRLLIVLAAASFLAFPVPAWAALSASVADASLAAVPYSHGAQASTGSLVLTAQDTGRQQCTLLLICTTVYDGWNVTMQASAFAYSGPNNGTAIPAANLVITTAHPPTRVEGQQISGTGGPRTTGVTGSLDVTRKTLQAEKDFGDGTYQQAIDVGLTVPGGARAGTYTTTLTVTISAGP